MKFVYYVLILMTFGFQSAIAQPTCTLPEVPISVTVDLAGQTSNDLLDDADNVVITMCDPGLANSQLTFVEWDNLTLDLPNGTGSWCVEARMAINIGINNPPGQGLFLTPWFDAGTSAGPCDVKSSGGPVDLVLNGIPLYADAGGCVTIQLWESFDDNPGGVDATYLAGTVTLSGCGIPPPTVPTLGEWGLIVLGLFILIAGVVYIRTSRESRLETVKA